MKFSKVLFSFLAVIAFFPFFNPGLVAAQARPANRALLYTSVPQQLATAFGDAFMKRRPDIRVEIYRAGSTEVGAKLAAEREVGGIRADLLWLPGAPPPFFLLVHGETPAYY